MPHIQSTSINHGQTTDDNRDSEEQWHISIYREQYFYTTTFILKQNKLALCFKLWLLQ
jgi:hypothetical protein